MNTNNTTNISLPELSTRAEVATYCRVSKETIRRWENQGKIKPRIVNSRVYRYHRDDVVALLGL